MSQNSIQKKISNGWPTVRQNKAAVVQNCNLNSTRQIHFEYQSGKSYEAVELD